MYKQFYALLRLVQTKKIQQPTDVVYTKNLTTSKNQSAPLYEYHVKTIAIIEGSSIPLNVNDILSSNNEYIAHSSPLISRDLDYTHRIHKRNTNATANATANEPSANITEDKEITKRHSYYSRNHRPHSGRGMTQAIIRENNSGFRSRSAFHPDESNIEGIFRKNVPIYDGIPSSRVSRYQNNFKQIPKQFHGAQEEEDEEEEEEDKDKPLSLEEIDPEHDAQYEHVPMTVDEFGKQKVMDTQVDVPDFHRKFTHSKYQGGNLGNNPFTNSFHKPPSVSYNFDNSVFRSHKPDQNVFPHSSTKFGTSHQYNSLADEEPRYYKHFSPSSQYHSSHSTSDENRPYSYRPSNPYGAHSSDSHFNDFDFSANRNSFSRRPSNEALRTTHVPQTLEEYHRIHNTFGNSRRSHGPYRGYNSRFNSHRNFPISEPQDDAEEEEDEKEEKDDNDEKEEADEKDEPPVGPKSFVSMNFKTFGNDDDDEGVSIKHHIGHSGPRFNSYRGNSGRSSEKEDVEYPPLPVLESSETMQDTSKFKENSDKIKSFVDSIFTKNKDIERGSGGRDSEESRHIPSPYNPNFGDRVKIPSKPAQNILWHRRAALPKENNFRNAFSRDKLVQEDNTRSFSTFNNVVNRPMKREVGKNNETESASIEETEEYEPSASAPEMNEESYDDDNYYWTESFSEPNE